MLIVLDIVLEIRVPKGTDGTPCEDVAQLIGVIGLEANLVLAEARPDVGGLVEQLARGVLCDGAAGRDREPDAVRELGVE
ncbi:hypothetical protein U4E84_08540 [Halorubrum sp. AD140]|uniref:hypothetical protein n=1 Tax=Halorubrum sp. AD140 TaxID=3050073 RepID=UPI002ACC93B4|nr:hypothetical protein [Halorubrum sp. AD140]MDZ5811392.1 hypothetical protein [Halorubrum sp. AD140]